MAAGGDPIRDALAAGKTLFNAWSTLGVAFAVELAADAGADLVTLDQQHGIGGHAELLAYLTAARAAGVPALVRVASNEAGAIGRALDAGAQGVICPMVNNAADARALADAVKYPPLGRRSTGPYRARLLLPNYFHNANAWTVACAQIETREAMDNIDVILTTPGIDMICVGPNDLAISLSDGQQADIRAPEVLEALDAALAKCREHGKLPGIFANDAEYAMRQVAKGWQIVAVSVDARWLANGAREAARAVHGE